MPARHLLDASTRDSKRSNRSPTHPRQNPTATLEPLEDRRLMSAADLDPTFGAAGKVRTDFANHWAGEFATDVAVSQAGKVVVAGALDDEPGGATVVARYDSRGRLDTSFSGDGKLELDLAPWGVGHRPFRALAVAALPGEKVLLAGRHGSQDGHLALVRLNANGTVDSTFGRGDGVADGVATFGDGTRSDYLYEAAAVTVQPDGKILVACHANFGLGSTMALTRLNSDGSLDRGFARGDDDGIDGAAVLHPEDGYMTSYTTDVALAPGGKIVLGGGRDYHDEKFAAIRFNADGSLDRTFSGDGRQTVTFQEDYVVNTGMAVTPDGKVVLSGWSWDGTTARIALARLTAGGELDRGFSGDGRAAALVAGRSHAAANDVAVVDGKILVAGYAHNGGWTGTDAVALARFNANGTLDGTFDKGDGTVLTAIGPRSYAAAMAVQGDGRIVLAGGVDGQNIGYYGDSTPDDLGVIRYVGDSGVVSGTVFNDADGDGVKDAGEAGVANVRVTLDAGRDGSVDRSVLTGADGSYKFMRLPEGPYRVGRVLPAGHRGTAPSVGNYDVTLAGGQVVSGRHFGVTRNVLIGGSVFNDANGDRARQGTERGLAGWRVFVDANRDGKWQSTERSVLTDAAGNWAFRDLPGGTQRLRVVQQAGWSRTTPTAGYFDVSLSAGGGRIGLLFGEKRIG